MRQSMLVGKRVSERLGEAGLVDVRRIWIQEKTVEQGDEQEKGDVEEEMGINEKLGSRPNSDRAELSIE